MSAPRRTTSEDLYRSVAEPPSSLADRVVLPSSGAGDAILQDKSKKAVTGGFPIVKELPLGPVLPVDISQFPVQPLHAFLRGPLSSCFETICKVLLASGSGFQIQSMKRDKGKLTCSLEEDKDALFQVKLWRVDNVSDRVLMEFIVLSPESNHSWSDIFDRLCGHVMTKPMLICRHQMSNSHISVGAALRKPVF